MLDDNVLMCVANGRSVAEVIMQRAWQSVAVEVAEIAMGRNVLCLYPIEELGIHIVELMERIGRVSGLQEQWQWHGPVGPTGKMLLLVVGVWHTYTDVAEIVVETVGHYVVCRADV